ncbi:MAG: BsuPI-related putative proteinase inhibitor [Clostridia bacterium]|nr:BsuPI-related putative proteinase inhibitor [Clostridia bacterium]
MKHAVKFVVIALIMALAIPFLTVPVLAQSTIKDPLSYYLSYNETDNQFQFVVANGTQKTVGLTFASGLDFDLAIRQEGEVIWQYSEGRPYTMEIRYEKLSPGQAKLYQAELPSLAAGRYEVLAYFAGGPSAGQPVASLALHISKTTGNNLEYSLQYHKASHEFSLLVTNNTKKNIDLTFPSAKKYDFTIFNKAGQKVWQFSQGKFYTQTIVKESLKPGQSKFYKIKLPALAAGEYTVAANYFAAGNNVVAKTKITVPGMEKPNLGLKFDAYYSGGQQPKIIFAVRNLTASPITANFPTGQKFEVVVKGGKGFTWRYSSSEKFGSNPSSETIRAGVNRFNYLYLPKLSPGQYTAQVYYLGVSSRNPVATASFTVR